MNNVEESKDEYIDIDINGRKINNNENQNKPDQTNTVMTTLDESIAETFV
jgi:hypothetical protein